MVRTAARRERRPSSYPSWQSAAARGPANDESPALSSRVGPEARFAYVFRALDLLKVHRRGRRMAVGICNRKAALRRPRSLDFCTLGARPRGGGAVF